jgi:hypothetical protein
MRSSSVVVGLVLGQDRPQVPFAEDQDPVGRLCSDGAHEPFRVGIRPRAPGRYLHSLDTGVGQGPVERRGELRGPVANQEAEVRSAVTEVHQEIPDLLHRPWPVRIRGHPEDVHVATANLHHEQAVHAAEDHCAVHVKEVRRKHRPGGTSNDCIKANAASGWHAVIGSSDTGPNGNGEVSSAFVDQTSCSSPGLFCLVSIDYTLSQGAIAWLTSYVNPNLDLYVGDNGFYSNWTVYGS